MLPALDALSILWVSNSVIATCANVPAQPNTPEATGCWEYRPRLKILDSELIKRHPQNQKRYLKPNDLLRAMGRISK
jgi:hypothetical protein